MGVERIEILPEHELVVKKQRWELMELRRGRMGRSRVPLGDLSVYSCGGVLINDKVASFLLSKSMGVCDCVWFGGVVLDFSGRRRSVRMSGVFLLIKPFCLQINTLSGIIILILNHFYLYYMGDYKYLKLFCAPEY